MTPSLGLYMETNALFIEINCKAGGFVGIILSRGNLGSSNLASQYYEIPGLQKEETTSEYII